MKEKDNPFDCGYRQALEGFPGRRLYPQFSIEHARYKSGYAARLQARRERDEAIAARTLAEEWVQLSLFAEEAG